MNKKKMNICVFFFCCIWCDKMKGDQACTGSATVNV